MVHVTARVAVDEEGVEAGHTHQPEADNEHAGDGATAKGHRQRRVDAVACGFGGTNIGANVDVHADEPCGTREHRANGKASRCQRLKEDRDEHEQHHANQRDGAVLASQIGRGAGFDRRSDFTHPVVTGGLRNDPAARHQAVHNRCRATEQGEKNALMHRHLLQS